MFNFFANRKGRKEDAKITKLCEPCETFVSFVVKIKICFSKKLKNHLCALRFLTCNLQHETFKT